MDSSNRTITVGLLGLVGLVGLVGCASQKLQRRAPARELYVSQLFKKTSAYAELTCDRSSRPSTASPTPTRSLSPHSR